MLADLVTWLPHDTRVGQAIIYYNIAAVYAITNDVENAFKNFNLVRYRYFFSMLNFFFFYIFKFVNLFGKTQPAHSFQLKFYLELLEGKKKEIDFRII